MMRALRMRLQSYRQNQIRSQRGQATLEFVLVLIVGMLIALGLLYRFNTGFKKYTTDLYGGYYRCLLEVGELPGTGGVCKNQSARYQMGQKNLVSNVPGSFSGSGGGGNGTGEGGGSGGGGGGGSGSGDGKKANAGKQNGQDGSDSGGGGGSGSGGEAVNGGGGSDGSGGVAVGRLFKNRGRTRATSVGNAGDAAGGAEKAAESEALKPDYSNSRNSADSLRRGVTKMDFKMEGGEYQREETQASVPMSATAATKKKDDRGDSLRPRVATEKTSRAPAKEYKDEGGGLSFSNLFRWFLIIGIIIAIVVFLGGQVLQISKSGER